MLLLALWLSKRCLNKYSAGPVFYWKYIGAYVSLFKAFPTKGKTICSSG